MLEIDSSSVNTIDEALNILELRSVLFEVKGGSGGGSTSVEPYEVQLSDVQSGNVEDDGGLIVVGAGLNDALNNVRPLKLNRQVGMTIFGISEGAYAYNEFAILRPDESLSQPGDAGETYRTIQYFIYLKDLYDGSIYVMQFEFEKQNDEDFWTQNQSWAGNIYVSH